MSTLVLIKTSVFISRSLEDMHRVYYYLLIDHIVVEIGMASHVI